MRAEVATDHEERQLIRRVDVREEVVRQVELRGEPPRAEIDQPVNEDGSGDAAAVFRAVVVQLPTRRLERRMSRARTLLCARVRGSSVEAHALSTMHGKRA